MTKEQKRTARILSAELLKSARGMVADCAEYVEEYDSYGGSSGVNVDLVCEWIPEAANILLAVFGWDVTALAFARAVYYM